MLNAVARIDPEERIPKEMLQNALIESGVKAATLARRLAVDGGTVSDWKLGRLPISPSRWLAIVAAIQELSPGWAPPKWRVGDPVPPIRAKPTGN